MSPDPQLSEEWGRVVGRPVWLRPDTSDAQVAADILGGAGGYHRPPESIRPRTVLDCGANIGLSAADYQRTWPNAKVIAVEPDHDNAAVARLNFDGPVLEYAVTDFNGSARLHRDGLAAEAYRLSREHGPGPSILCATLSHLVQVFFDGTCDFVKLDIEGEEQHVLRDTGWAEHVRWLLVECHEQITGYGWRDAITDLEAQGFTAARHTAHPQAVWAKR